MTDPIFPGAVIGILGSGQLGRMAAIAARRLGYRVHVFSPHRETPTGEVANVEVRAAYEDLAAVERFAEVCDVVTLEFENVPRMSADAAARHVPVRPAGSILHTVQHRLREKGFLAEAGFPVTGFRAIRSEAECRSVDEELLPGILKTASFGYDGKGQARVASRDELLSVWTNHFGVDAILERTVDFQCEISVVVARSPAGEVTCYQPFENEHVRHILDVSVSPARVAPKVARRATELARQVAVKLELVGVLCVEMFVTSDDELLINELAPRPHNSGHLTIDAHVVDQFEQQVRAVCGLPLGSTRQRRPAAMVNLLGELWDDGEPHWSAALRAADVKLHLYGKRSPRRGRKMGHLTAVGDDVEQARALALQARARLGRTSPSLPPPA